MLGQKRRMKPLIGVGPSGSGKTRLLFDLASMHPAIYIECQGLRVNQADVVAFSYRMKNASRGAIEKRERLLNKRFKAIIAARLLLFQQYYASHHAVWDNAVHCKRWLIAQLNGVTEPSAKLFEVLRKSANVTDDLLAQVRVKLKELDLLFLFDEAHMWHDTEYGQFTDSRGNLAAKNGMRTLLTKVVYFSGQMNLTSMWVGTALRLSDLDDLQSALGLVNDRRSEYIVGGFRALTSEDVGKTLRHFLDARAARVINTICHELKGRGRWTSEFLALCRKNNVTDEQSLMSAFQTVQSLALTNSEEEEERTLYNRWCELLDGKTAFAISFLLFN
jgi:hypothetical protein